MFMRKALLCLVYQVMVHASMVHYANMEKRKFGKNILNVLTVKFGYSEKATKFEKIFHLKCDATH